MTRPAPSASATAAEDEIGTPFCITFDFNTVGTETDEADHCVTVRERDSMEQVRIPISEVKAYISRAYQILKSGEYINEVRFH